jgi:TonB family protein
MKKHSFWSISLLWVLLTVTYNPAYAQENSRSEVYTFTEQMPEFKGDLFKYIAEHLKYPEKAREMNIDGRVLAQFIIGVDGSISNIKILKSTNEIFNDAAIEVISNMPNWKPGRQNKEVVNVLVNVPILFVLDNKKTGGEKKGRKTK